MRRLLASRRSTERDQLLHRHRCQRRRLVGTSRLGHFLGHQRCEQKKSPPSLALYQTGARHIDSGAMKWCQQVSPAGSLAAVCITRAVRSSIALTQRSRRRGSMHAIGSLSGGRKCISPINPMPMGAVVSKRIMHRYRDLGGRLAGKGTESITNDAAFKNAALHQPKYSFKGLRRDAKVARIKHACVETMLPVTKVGRAYYPIPRLLFIQTISALHTLAKTRTFLSSDDAHFWHVQLQYMDHSVRAKYSRLVFLHQLWSRMKSIAGTSK